MMPVFPTEIEKTLNIVSETRPKRALLVGRYKPIYLPYFQTPMTLVELQGLSREDLDAMIAEVQSFFGHEDFTSKGVEKIEDRHGRYHPGLFWAAVNRCSSLGFTSIEQLVDHFPQEIFSMHRPEYSSLGDEYLHIFENLTLEEQQAVYVIANKENNQNSFTIKELGLYEHEPLVGLLERMILERSQEDEPTYKGYDTSFLRYVKAKSLKPKTKPMTHEKIAVVACIIASVIFLCLRKSPPAPPPAPRLYPPT